MLGVPDRYKRAEGPTTRPSVPEPARIEAAAEKSLWAPGNGCWLPAQAPTEVAVPAQHPTRRDSGGIAELD
jgi:hypothetical protein